MNMIPELAIRPPTDPFNDTPVCFHVEYVFGPWAKEKNLITSIQKQKQKEARSLMTFFELFESTGVITFFSLFVPHSVLNNRLRCCPVLRISGRTTSGPCLACASLPAAPVRV